MARYDVYRARGLAGWVLDLQSDLLEPLNTRIVVPLMPIASAPKPAKRLNPIFEIDGEQVVMVTQFASAVSMAEIGKPVANLGRHSAEITSALDMLFQGF